VLMVHARRLAMGARTRPATGSVASS
jgi:hypothetical protein